VVKKTCSIDWSNGEDLTCIAFASNEGGKAHLTKVLYLTPEETALVRSALQRKESPPDSPATPAQQLKAEIRSIITEMEQYHHKDDFGDGYKVFINKLRELSAV